MSNNTMTYRDGINLLGTFLRQSPDVHAVFETAAEECGQRLQLGIPATPAFFPRSRLYMALIWQFGDFDGRVFTNANSPITDSSWYKKATTTDPLSPPPLWTLDDTLSTVGMLAFALPEGGAMVSAGIGAAQKLADNLSKQADFKEKLSEAGNVPDSPLDILQRELERFMTTEDISRYIEPLMSRVRLLQSLLSKMLNDPSDVTSAGQGFRASWLNASNDKYTALNPDDGLGAVWQLIETDAFKILAAQGHPKTESAEQAAEADPPLTTLALIDPPTKSMCTIDAYCKIMGVVVNSIVLYAEVCLMPEEALRPGWNPKSFNTKKAIQSPVWNEVPKRCEKSAKDCWEYLLHNFDPDSDSLNFMTRVHPQQGDARKAFDLIKKRLDRITFNCGLAANRDGLWFLEQDKPVDTMIAPARTGDVNNVFRGACASGQSEVKDTAIHSDYTKEKNDDFIANFRQYQTTLTMSWHVDNSFGNLLGTFFTGAVNADAALWYRDHHPNRKSPWNETAGDDGIQTGGYDQVCWGPDSSFMVGSGNSLSEAVNPGFMDNPIGRDAVAWYSFVLKNYATAMNYKIDPARGTSIIDSVRHLYDAWSAVHETAARLIALASAAR